MKLLENIKKEGGPLTPSDIDRMETMDQKQLLQQIKYLRATVAPNIKQQRKTLEGKFSLFNIDEMKNEIRTVLKPENDMREDLEDLLMTVLKTKDSKNEVTDNVTVNEPLKDGLIGMFEDKNGDNHVCLVLDSETLQPFKKTRYGFSPTILTEQLEGWKLLEAVEDYSYVSCRGGVFLQF